MPLLQARTQKAGNVNLAIIKIIITVLDYLLMQLLVLMVMDFIVKQIIEKAQHKISA